MHLVTMHDLKFPDPGISSPDTPSSLLAVLSTWRTITSYPLHPKHCYPSGFPSSHLWNFHQPLSAKQMLLSVLKYLFMCLQLLDYNLFCERTEPVFYSAVSLPPSWHSARWWCLRKGEVSPLPGVQPRFPSQPALNLYFHRLHRTIWLCGVMRVRV